jgi:hypothetical protein
VLWDSLFQLLHSREFGKPNLKVVVPHLAYGEKGAIIRVYESDGMIRNTLSRSFVQLYCPNPCGMHDLGELYSQFNAKYFEGELPVLKPHTVVDENEEVWESYPKQIAWNGRFKKLYGRYTYSPARGRGFIELSKRIALDPILVRSTMLHEMLHKYLDLKALGDGIEGHGPNFVEHGVRINRICESEKVEYRINFFDHPVEDSNPRYLSETYAQEFPVRKDLDLGRKMAKIMKASFDSSYTYLQ